MLSAARRSTFSSPYDPSSVRSKVGSSGMTWQTGCGFRLRWSCQVSWTMAHTRRVPSCPNGCVSAFAKRNHVTVSIPPQLAHTKLAVKPVWFGVRVSTLSYQRGVSPIVPDTAMPITVTRCLAAGGCSGVNAGPRRAAGLRSGNRPVSEPRLGIRALRCVRTSVIP